MKQDIKTIYEATPFISDITGKYHYVYKIVNIKNGMFYFGVHSTKKLNDHYFGSGKYIKRAVDSKPDDFIKYVINFYKTSQECYQVEKELVTENEVKNPMCYNLCLGGRINAIEGKSIPEEVKKKISNSLKGRSPNISPEGKRRIIEAARKPCSEETKKKISKANKGLKRSEDVKKKLSEAHKGKKGRPMTQDLKNRISEANKGKIRSEETKKKISQSLKGKKHSEETKLKLKGRKAHNSKFIIIDGEYFESLSKAAIYLGIPTTSLSCYLKYKNTIEKHDINYDGN